MSVTDHTHPRARRARALAKVVSLATQQVALAAARHRRRHAARSGAGGGLLLLSLAPRPQVPQPPLTVVAGSVAEEPGGEPGGEGVGARIYELPVRPTAGGSTSGPLAEVIRLR